MGNYKLNTGGLSFNFTAEDLAQLDLTGSAPRYNILQSGKNNVVEVVAQNGKSVTLKVNGNIHEITIEDEVDQLIDKMGLNAIKEVILKDIKAPMPGLILDIMVKPGQEIQKGDAILILEAMKMENVIKAEGQGIVKEVKLNKGAAVEKNQIIIEME